MAAVPIGRMRHRVSLQTRADTAAASGGLTEAFTTVATVWGEITGSTAADYLASRQTEETVTHTMVTRWLDAYATPTHVLHGTLRYAIRGVRALDGRRERLQWDLQEIRTDGS